MTRLYSLRLPLYCVAAVLAGLVAMAASPKPSEKPLWELLMPKGLDEYPSRPYYRAWRQLDGNSPNPPDPQFMVNKFADFADRQSDTMYLIISHGRNYVYGWTSSGKKKLVQTIRDKNIMSTIGKVADFPYIKAIETWNKNIIRKFPYDFDFGPSRGKFFPDMIFRVIYNKNRMKISKIYINMDSIYARSEYYILLGSYETCIGGFAY